MDFSADSALLPATISGKFTATGFEIAISHCKVEGGGAPEESKRIKNDPEDPRVAVDGEICKLCAARTAGSASRTGSRIRFTRANSILLR